MVKCKICGEQEAILYWLCRERMCIHCYLKIDKLRNPTKLDEEWLRRDKISEITVKKYLDK